MSHWFNISRWREALFGRSAPDRAKPNPAPDLYQHRVQQIIARTRQANVPTAVLPDPAAQVGAADQRVAGLAKSLAGATGAMIARKEHTNLDEPEESEHWVSFGVGMAAGVACGWALLFFTMAAMEPDPSLPPRDGATAIELMTSRSVASSTRWGICTA